MYKHIMVPVDGSELSLKALPQAAALAKAVGAKVTLITVVSHFHSRVTAPLTAEIVHELERVRDEEARKPADKLHAELVAQTKSGGVDCESLVVLGDNVYAEIIEKAEARGCDLIVMASHGRRGLDAVLVGSETTKVLTHSKIPVLIVR